MNITFEKIDNTNINYKLIHKWCSNKDVYEWFEQRVLSLEEITNKYKNKLNENTQTLFIVKYNNRDIGLFQIYKFEDDIEIEELKKFQNIYEFDLFIGEKEYLSKGIGREIVNMIDELIYSEYSADAIILRPFKRNIRAIKCYEKCNYKLIKDYNENDTLGKKEIISIMLNSKITK